MIGQFQPIVEELDKKKIFKWQSQKITQTINKQKKTTEMESKNQKHIN